MNVYKDTSQMYLAVESWLHNIKIDQANDWSRLDEMLLKASRSRLCPLYYILECIKRDIAVSDNNNCCNISYILTVVQQKAMIYSVRIIDHRKSVLDIYSLMHDKHGYLDNEFNRALIGTLVKLMRLGSECSICQTPKLDLLPFQRAIAASIYDIATSRIYLAISSELETAPYRTLSLECHGFDFNSALWKNQKW